MKKYESPKFLLTKYEVDESIAVEVSGMYTEESGDHNTFDEMFGNQLKKSHSFGSGFFDYTSEDKPKSKKPFANRKWLLILYKSF